MKLNYAYLLLLVSICFSCGNGNSQNPSYNIDSKILSCDEITMENHTGEIDKSEFSYGEKITLSYKDITGFVLEDSLAYPDMDILVMNKKGDTIMAQKNLFKNSSQGHTEEDLNLRSNLTFAEPMMPNNSYVMHINISDKKGDGYFNVKKNFSIIDNPILKTKKDGLTYNILYLYSQTRDIAVVDNKISPNESVYVLLEGLNGFTTDEEGKVDLKASISLTDANGIVINKKDDLFTEPVSAKDLKEQLYASLAVTEGQVSNPVTCLLQIKDKKSGNTLDVSVDLTVE